ncbi:MAG: hypothetical protein HY420_02610 [Candidatus Kerfeldbacteria bacterium]|nr:hypothetical protein [Candidatus Kerfeldbacteria bacterium]
MRQSEVLDFYDEDVHAIRQLVTIMDGLGGDFWRQEPEGHFGPGEEFVHLVQSGRFACRFIREQLGLDPPTELEPYFQRAAFNHAELTKLNLRGARTVRGQHNRSCIAFIDWLNDELQTIRGLIDGIPEDRYGDTVSHPLVHMVGPTGEVLARMFARHWPYHLGQITEAMKSAGFREHVPFLLHFGRFEEVSVKEE